MQRHGRLRRRQGKMNKFNLRQPSAKEIRKIHIWLRALIQLFYFIFLPSAYTAAFAGVKYIFTRIGAGEKLELTAFVTVLLVLCLYTIVFGRFFCGFACAFGSLGDGVHALYLWICKKLKKKPVKINVDLAAGLSVIKYVILAVIAVMCFAGVYAKVQGTSPWDVFSMLHAGNFKLGGYIAGIVLLCLIIAGMCIQERFFCRFLCPMGAVFSLLPVLPFFALHRDRDRCIRGCSACTRKCPSSIGLPQQGSLEVKSDCFWCQKCIDTCPKGNIHCGIEVVKGNEVWFTLFRALLLFCLFMWMGL